MARQPNLEHGSMMGSQIRGANKFLTLIQTLTGTFAMDADMAHMLFLDPGGAAREVRLPPAENGLFYTIVNTADAAEVITVKDSTGTTTFGTFTQNESIWAFSNGTTWFFYAMVA